jgi:hypothetical protein
MGMADKHPKCPATEISGQGKAYSVAKLIKANSSRFMKLSLTQAAPQERSGSRAKKLSGNLLVPRAQLGNVPLKTSTDGSLHRGA